MAGNFEIHETGLLQAQVGIRGILGRKDRVKHLLNRAARSAEATMKIAAPRRSGAMARSIAKSDPQFRPGGAGGGGTWVVMVGVTETLETRSRQFGGLHRRGPEKFGPGTASHYPTMVFHGTGVYGPKGRAIKTEPGNVMVIEDYKARDVDRGRGIVLGGRTGRLAARPGIIYTHQVLGQRPQQEWFHEGRRRAELVIASNLHRVFHLGDPMDDI